jgi:hypothetical protein
MPATALKHLAKKAKISLDKAEHLWDKSKEIVDAEYPYDKKDERYWALRMGITKKMMGLGEQLSFSDFLALQEAAVGYEPSYKPVEVERAIAALNKHAKNALWMLHEDTPLYRGDRSSVVTKAMEKTGFLMVDTSATERKSENTSNYYTVLLDNHPDRGDFPKRSRSFIGSTNFQRSKGYHGWGSDNGPMVMIPYDDTKIVLVNHEDMWDTDITLFGRKENIEGANNHFDYMDLKADIQDFERFAARLKQGDSDAIERFRKCFGTQKAEKYAKTFMEELWKAYSAASTGHTAHTTKTLPRPLKKTEVWVGGKVILIDHNMWKKMRAALK